ncbi:MAG: winged helix-turn-helix domain-containing protein [Acidobacteria bacterium]|nr:winged helix-turn-helix domain-containing protein [Acidobacteriota bacterium]
MSTQMNHFYEFGEFRLEPARRKFYQGGTVVPLTPKVFDLLVVLLQNQGRVLEKSYLLKQVWPDVIVEEHSLTQAISVLRKIVGDKQPNHNYIKTVPGRGYQFISQVKEVIEADEPDSSRIPAPLVRTPSRRLYFAATFLIIGIFAGIVPLWLSSVASRMSARRTGSLTTIGVKPFHSADKESCKTGLSETLTDAVVTKLSKLDALTVRPLEHNCSNTAHAHTSSSGVHKTTEPSVKGGGESRLDSTRDFADEAVVEGQVQKQGEKFRVSVRLTRTSDGVVLWADQVETGYPNDGSMQDRISALVAQAVLTRKAD